ncbi:MAG: tetratricopeptide repeat protein [Bacteroidales bacterium]
MKRITMLLAATLSSGALTISAQLPYNTDSSIDLLKRSKMMFEQDKFMGSVDYLNRYSISSGAEMKQDEAAFLKLYTSYELNRSVDFELFLKEYPHSAYTNFVRLIYGSSLLEQEKIDQAIEILTQADSDLLSKADREHCRYRLAYAFLLNDQFSNSKPMFNELSRSSAIYSDKADFYLSYISYREGEYAKALKGFLPLQNISQYRSIVPYYIVQIYFAQGNYTAAIKLGQELLLRESDPANVAEVKRIVGESYYYSGDQRSATAHLSQYVKMSSQPTRSAWYALGLCLYDAGDMQGTISALSKVTLGNDIYSQTAYYHLGLAYLSQKDYSKARMAFESASNMEYNDTIRELAMYNYALTIYSTSYTPFNESVGVFEQFLNRYPNSLYADKASEYLSEVLLTTKDYQGSLDMIAKIARPGAKILSAKQRILFYLGSEQVVNSHFKNAIEYFTAAINVGNYNAQYRAEALYWRGESYYRLEDYKRAISDYTAFTSQTPDRSKPIYTLAMYNLGYSYFKSFDFVKARSFFTQFIDLSKEKKGTLYADALNRLADCQYYRREFALAEENYAKVATLKSGFEDYALYQKAMMQGIRKQNDRKIETIDQLIATYPKSEYVDDALLERGLIQASQNKYAGAIADLNKLISQFPNSNIAPTAAIQLSTVYRNMGDNSSAINAYKSILSKYPGSEQAKMANADFKELAQETNSVSDYANYINTLGWGFKFSATEQDSLTYFAAEQIYIKGNRDAADKSFVDYIQSFPQGAFTLSANYYLGTMAYEKGDMDRAMGYLNLVTSMPKSIYTEDAVTVLATINYVKKEYREAQRLYRELSALASKRSVKLQANIGEIRSAYALSEYAEVNLIASRLLEDKSLDPDQLGEILYLHAKSLMAEKQSGKAADVWMILSKDTRSAYGAEAKFQLADYYYRAKQYDKAEKTLGEFVEQGTPHQYWMARSFILWSDIYMQQDDPFQAKQYLMNLRGNYKANDDIDGMIEERLKVIESK